MPRVDDRRVLSGIIFINRNGLRWCDAPNEYGPHKTLYNRWKRWSDMRVLARIMIGLARQFFGLTFGAVDISVDRLVTDPDWLTIISQASGDLFRRPAFNQSVDHMVAQVIQTDQLAPTRVPFRSGSMFMGLCRLSARRGTFANL